MSRAFPPRDFVALALGAAALAGSMALLDRVRRRTDPRPAAVRSIRGEAGPRDLLVVTDDSPELLARMEPYPALWGVPPMPDLTGVRRVYGVAPTAGALAPLFARFGPAAPFRGEALARRWDVADRGLARVVYQATEALGTTLQARREGGTAEGPCPPAGDRLACNGEPYHQVVIAPLHFEGVEQRCVFAHPHEGGPLVLELSNIPPSRAIVGVYGLDDAAIFPEGAPVTMRVALRTEKGAGPERTFVAQNRRGLTPYRIDLRDFAGSATVTVAAPRVGARSFCFTLTATR
ncbi:MAG: hypothetical protein U0324_07365 [Polyangiales bacterium]